MKFVIALAACFAISAAAPTDSSITEQDAPSAPPAPPPFPFPLSTPSLPATPESLENLFPTDGGYQLSYSNDSFVPSEKLERSKRFIFFKFFYPAPVVSYAAPVVRYVETPVTYQVS